MTRIPLCILVFNKLIRSLIKNKPREFIIYWNCEDQRILNSISLSFRFDRLIKLRGRILLNFNESDHLVALSIWAVGKANNLSERSQSSSVIINLEDSFFLGTM